MIEKLVYPKHTTFDEFVKSAESYKGQQIVDEVRVSFVSDADIAGHTKETPHGAVMHIPGYESVFFENLSKVHLIGFILEAKNDGLVL